MSINRGLLNWGVFLIVLGAVPLAVYWNAIDSGVARDLLRLWPLILIGLGLGLLLRFTPLAALGGVVVAATAGLLIGAVIAGGWGGVAGACIAPARSDAALETRSSPFAGDTARLDVELSCADLSVDRAGGDNWIVRADFAGGQPTLDSQPDRLILRDRPMGPFDAGRASREVHVSLPEAPSMTTQFTLNASTGHIELGGQPLSLFSATLNASDVDVRLTDADMSSGQINLTLNASAANVSLPAAGTGSTGSISLNAASLDLCAPPDLALRIVWDARLSSGNFAAAGLERVGEAWQTPDWDALAEGVELSVSANVSSITLSRSGGCP